MIDFSLRRIQNACNLFVDRSHDHFLMHGKSRILKIPSFYPQKRTVIFHLSFGNDFISGGLLYAKTGRLTFTNKVVKLEVHSNRLLLKVVSVSFLVVNQSFLLPIKYHILITRKRLGMA